MSEKETITLNERACLGEKFYIVADNERIMVLFTEEEFKGEPTRESFKAWIEGLPFEKYRWRFIPPHVALEVSKQLYDAAIAMSPKACADILARYFMGLAAEMSPKEE